METVVKMLEASGLRESVIHAKVAEIIIVMAMTSSSATAVTRSFMCGSAFLYVLILFCVSVIEDRPLLRFNGTVFA